MTGLEVPGVQRLVCDEMLQRLAHWLRIAGHDVLLAVPGEDDRSLFQRTVADNRLLLTRDRKIAEYRNADSHVVIVGSNGLTAIIEEVSRRLSINWLAAPLSRCALCNSKLTVANDTQLQRLPPGLIGSVTGGYFCPHCDKLYWEGGHVQRMRKTLERFSRRDYRFV